MKKKTVFAIAAVVIVAIVIFIFVQGNNGKTKAVPVRTGKITQETIIEQLSTTGTLIPNQSQSFIGTGTVIDVNVSVDDKVEKDKVLATYDNGLQLVAAFAGTVTQVNIKAGQTDSNAQLGKASIQVDDLSTLKVQLELSNSEAALVKVNQKAIISSTNQTFAGKVTEKDPIATSSQSSTGTSASLGAVVAFDKNPENLYAGFDADVAITTNTIENAVALPIEALTYTDNNEPIVFVIKNGVAKETKIEIGIQSDKLIEVKKGLEKDQTVILSPTSDIKNNTEVTKE